MIKNYYVEVKFGVKWHLLKTTKRQTDAMHFLKTQIANEKGEFNEYGRYPLRIVREVRTIVFDGSK